MYQRLTFIIISLFILVLLSVIYLDLITPIFDGLTVSFGEYGYPKGDFNFFKLFFAFLFIIMLSFIVPLYISSPSSIVLIIYYYVAIVPFLSLFVISVTASDNIYYIDFVSIIIFYSITFALLDQKNNTARNVKKVNLKKLKIYSIVIFSIGLSLTVFLYVSYAKGSLISISNLLDVYGQRDNFNNKSGIIGSIITGYIIYGVIPFFIFMYKIHNLKIYLALSLLLGFITFLATGSKLFLGSVFIIIILTKFHDKEKSKSHLVIGVSLLFLVLTSYILQAVFSQTVLLSLFVRRMLIIPAQLFSLFHEHAMNYGYNYLSKYTSFITGKDSISIAHEIGNKYYRVGSSANNGMISDAFGNFGIMGVIFYALFFVLVFRFIDRLNVQSNLLLTPLFAGLAISFTNSSLLAVFIYQVMMLVITFKSFNFINRARIK